MSKTVRNILIIVVLLAVAGAGVYLYITRPTPEASENVQDNTEQLETSGDETSNEAVFRISQDDSTVEFRIDEMLRGSPYTAVGTTNEIAGDILINFDDPSATDIGEMRINARTFATDSSNRDRAIANEILRSAQDEYEFITFNPTGITGLPESVAVGDTLEVEITGELTIQETTNEVTFSGSVTVDSEDQISGTFETTVLRSDYGLTIPTVPFVADVSDEVILAINFVANRVADDA